MEACVCVIKREDLLSAKANSPVMENVGFQGYKYQRREEGSERESERGRVYLFKGTNLCRDNYRYQYSVDSDESVSLGRLAHK